MLTQIPYNREKAVEYARRWALSRNPLFVDFTGGGGNCTNFVSQSLLAGCGVMDFTPTFGWYYRSINDRAPAWSGVDEMYGFLTGSGDFEGQTMQGPFATEVRMRRQIEIGDVVQLANSEGAFYHTLIISGFEGNDILVCAHSDDALDRRLSTYNYATLRVLHIEGVLIDLPLEIPFQNLLDGTALQVISAQIEDVI
ncbi:MAG: amidase domain-containing protein [Clostridia bacterium]|nr:amidase domain-containing protein [Clostridia bacterium]